MNCTDVSSGKSCARSLGKGSRLRHIAREGQRERRGIVHVAAPSELERPGGALSGCGRIPVKRFPHGRGRFEQAGPFALADRCAISTGTADIRLASCKRPERARASASRCEIMSSVERFLLATAAVRLMSSSSPFRKATKYRTRSKLRRFELALRRATDRHLGILEAIQVELTDCLLAYARCQIGIERDGLVGFGDRQLILAGACRWRNPTAIREDGIARVGLRPRLQGPLLPFQIAGDVAVVQRVDEEALDVAGPIAQLVGLECALSRQRRLSQDAVAEPDLRMGRSQNRDRSRPHAGRAAGPSCASPLT